MSIADVYESGEQKQNKSHLENLISVALTDGTITDTEKALLQKFANRLSIDNITFETMLKGSDKYAINPPADKEERYKRLYNLVNISLIDNILDAEEERLLHKYAIGLGYEQNQANELITKTLGFVKEKIAFEEAYEKI